MPVSTAQDSHQGQVILLHITYLASLTEWTEHAYRTGYVGTVRLAPTNNTVQTVLNKTFSKHECFKDRHVPTIAQHTQTDVLLMVA